jgi:glutathione S-transferase
MKYTLYYWPGIQGRGEFIRLALEEAGADYVDTAFQSAREGGGVPALMACLQGEDVMRPPFAPPFLKAGRQLIGQTANILLFLGPRHGLVPKDAAGQLWVHQLQLTIADFVVEIHDTHHPCGGSLYYEEQKTEAKRRTKEFLTHRLSKYLDYFERVIDRNRSGPWMAGRRLSYSDLSMAQIISGLPYAFPASAPKALRCCPRLRALHETVFDRPRIRAYLESDRRLAFNNDDLFRRYPELDP